MDWNPSAHLLAVATEFGAVAVYQESEKSDWRLIHCSAVQPACIAGLMRWLPHSEPRHQHGQRDSTAVDDHISADASHCSVAAECSDRLCSEEQKLPDECQVGAGGWLLAAASATALHVYQVRPSPVSGNKVSALPSASTASGNSGSASSVQVARLELPQGCTAPQSLEWTSNGQVAIGIPKGHVGLARVSIEERDAGSSSCGPTAGGLLACTWQGTAPVHPDAVTALSVPRTGSRVLFSGSRDQTVRKCTRLEAVKPRPAPAGKRGSAASSEATTSGAIKDDSAMHVQSSTAVSGVGPDACTLRHGAAAEVLQPAATTMPVHPLPSPQSPGLQGIGKIHATTIAVPAAAVTQSVSGMQPQAVKPSPPAPQGADGQQPFWRQFVPAGTKHMVAPADPKLFQDPSTQEQAQSECVELCRQLVDLSLGGQQRTQAKRDGEPLTAQPYVQHRQDVTDDFPILHPFLFPAGVAAGHYRHNRQPQSNARQVAATSDVGAATQHAVPASSSTDIDTSHLTPDRRGLHCLWKGDTRGFLEAAFEAKAETPEVAALSIGAGYPTWQLMANLQAVSHQASGQNVAAVLHLLAAGDVAGALALCSSAGLSEELQAIQKYWFQ